MNATLCETDSVGQFPHTLRTRTHSFGADMLPDAGGTDTAPGPHDYFDAALVSCKALTAMWYAKRHSIPLERVHASVESDNADERKGTYRLHVRLAFEGPLSKEQRRALEGAVAACPVHKLMTTSDVVVDTVVDG